MEPDSSKIRPSYQLSRYPVGSIMEVWAVSYPLMLAVLSWSIMVFTDRLLLAKYSTEALNAAAIAGMASIAFVILIFGLAAISEVFVGRFNGAKEVEKTGLAVWQTLWIILSTLPLFLLIIWLAPRWIFLGSGNEVLETTYFRIITFVGFIEALGIALAGFFIGRGAMSRVTIVAYIGNGLNIPLDLLMIFGFGPIPEMGVAGAALATGIAACVKLIFLLCWFWRKEHRELHGTLSWRPDLRLIRENLELGLPSSLGHVVQFAGHFAFWRIVQTQGPLATALMAMGNSFILLFVFANEGMSKAVTALISNLYGAKQLDKMSAVIRSALIVCSFVAFVLVFVALGFYEDLGRLFLPDALEQYGDPRFVRQLWWVLLLAALTFLVDSFNWIFVGVLTALGDTRFILVVSILSYWLICVGSAWFVIGKWHYSVPVAWLIIVMSSLSAACIYFLRYYSRAWERR